DINIDEMWKKIQKAIQRATKNMLSKKKKNTKTFRTTPENEELKSFKKI
ncbi:12525_t:CDS:1, partial [Dentiscutata heterogama]